VDLEAGADVGVMEIEDAEGAEEVDEAD